MAARAHTMKCKYITHNADLVLIDTYVVIAICIIWVSCTIRGLNSGTSSLVTINRIGCVINIQRIIQRIFGADLQTC